MAARVTKKVATKKKATRKKAAPKTSAASRPFPGYSKKGMTWLRQIAKHNERDWFLAHKATFDKDVKEATEALVAALGARLAAFAPQHVPPDAKKAVLRIYRDVRFSKDKSPYHTTMRATFGRVAPDGTPGGPDDCAGFWCAISGTGVDIGGGAYAPGGPQLAALRSHIASEHRALTKLLKRKALVAAMGTLQGEQLKRPPRGFDADHPAIELLRHKQLYLQAHLPATVIATPDLQKEILRHFKLLVPFVGFLNEGIAS